MENEQRNVVLLPPPLQHINLAFSVGGLIQLFRIVEQNCTRLLPESRLRFLKHSVHHMDRNVIIIHRQLMILLGYTQQDFSGLCVALIDAPL